MQGMHDDATLRPDDDRTVIRPRADVPGYGALPVDDRMRPAMPTPARAELGDFLRGGANPIARAASPLLILSVQLRHSVDVPDIPRLREQAVAQIRQFENHTQSLGVPAQTVLAARYVLCTMIDESVLNTPWGEPTGWSQKTLLVTFHGETYGGAKFFQILDRLVQDFSRHLDLIELMYTCLALGFGGRYLVEPGGLGRLADIQEDLYRRIRGLREAPATELAPHWRGMDDRRNPFLRHVPSWMIVLAATCVLLVAFLYFSHRLDGLGEPLGGRLATIGVENALPPDARPRTPVARKTLKQLLAPEEQAGKLSIDEQPDGRASVRLAAAEMFPSGGADIVADEVPLLHRITWALNQVPGRVVVVGHTDDQPVRSLRFKDNFDLSTQRARNTASILATGLNDPRRLDSSGAGPSQPVATPVDVPANRARNRRVEIMYLPEIGS